MSDGFTTVYTARAGPDVKIEGDEVTVSRCFDIKDSLKNKGFRWDSRRKVWAQQTVAVLELLGATDIANVTLEAILQSQPRQETEDRSEDEEQLHLKCEGRDVIVTQCYHLKNSLRRIGFAWRPHQRVWACKVDRSHSTQTSFTPKRKKISNILLLSHIRAFQKPQTINLPFCHFPSDLNAETWNKVNIYIVVTLCNADY